ncbi:hypothetical protein RSOL_393070, partial [Rhizoctonia solani AG-3 Rhs1AP]
MSSNTTSTPALSSAPPSPTWGTPSFNEPEEGLWDQAWDIDWSLTIYVLGNHGQTGYFVHYDHLDNFDSWAYIPLGWTGHLHLPKNSHVEANMEARVDAFGYWALNDGADPNNWLGELTDDIRIREDWYRNGRDRLEHSTPSRPWYSRRLYLEQLFT